MSVPSCLLALIVGMGRGGTTWMSNCLDNHPDVSVFGETYFWGRKFVKPCSDGFYTREQIDYIKKELKAVRMVRHGVGTLRRVSEPYFATILDQAFACAPSKMAPADVFLTICQAVANIEKKRWVIEKTPHHVNWINRILNYIPNVKLILTFREPYGFMLSYKFQVNSHKIGPAEKRRRQKLYHPIGCAFVWRGYTKAISEGMAKHPETSFFVNFDEIKSNPQLVAKKVQEFLGLKTSNDILSGAVNTSFPSGSRPELGCDDVFWMNLIARREMRAFGIKRRTPNYDPMLIALSIFKIPIWVVNVFIQKRKLIEGGLCRYFWNWLRPRSAGHDHVVRPAGHNKGN